MDNELKKAIEAFLDDKDSSEIFSIMYNHIYDYVKVMSNIELRKNKSNPNEIAIVDVKKNKDIFNFEFIKKPNTTVIYNSKTRRYFFIKLDDNGEIICTKVLKSQSGFDNDIYELKDIDENSFESNKIYDVNKLLKGLIE